MDRNSHEQHSRPLVSPAATGADGRLLVRTGGQTGVDRAATDVAIELGLRYGGFVPLGGWAEDEPEPPGICRRYGAFTPLDDPDPSVRTGRNVAAAEAVVVLWAPGVASPGTERTVACAAELGRPLLLVDPTGPGAPGLVAAFLGAAAPLWDLLVAGPRASEDAAAYDRARALLAACAPWLLAAGGGASPLSPPRSTA